MKCSIVLSTQRTAFEGVAYKGEWEQNAAKMAHLGYDGVELAVRDPSLLDVTHVQQVLCRLHLEVPAIGTGQAYGEEGLSFTDPQEKVRRRAVERVKKHIDFARTLQAMVIIGLIRGQVQKGISREQAMEWLITALAECAQYAMPNVHLVLEPLNRYETNLINTVAEGLECIQTIGAGNIGLLFDTFHANIEEVSLEEAMRLAGGRLLHVHVADSNRWYPGAGHIDFAKVIAVLREIGYNGGYLSVEAMPKPDADTCAQRALATLRSLCI
nr:sugar phosphate isomerase/epimerase [Chloroflexota bacterium]